MHRFASQFHAIGAHQLKYGIGGLQIGARERNMDLGAVRDVRHWQDIQQKDHERDKKHEKEQKHARRIARFNQMSAEAKKKLNMSGKSIPTGEVVQEREDLSRVCESLSYICVFDT